jgi:hypothetical protein
MTKVKSLFFKGFLFLQSNTGKREEEEVAQKEEEEEDQEAEPVSPSAGRSSKCTFIQRNFLPGMYCRPDQNLQRACHQKPTHFSLFLSEKWRMLTLVSALKFPEQ